ncbi:unnamed protein product [Phytophthora lilii]|uniref:Unnamed protein product n=1 Tax=Phytophthora lilii TaxID=2077276 RepID=A0A9W6T8U2_9STRA|nr:unnamed protein product [Phytophthora lilii]
MDVLRECVPVLLGTGHTGGQLRLRDRRQRPACVAGEGPAVVQVDSTELLEAAGDQGGQHAAHGLREPVAGRHVQHDRPLQRASRGPRADPQADGRPQPTVAMVKRKKHDKDKYYNLARQQGYRARSAFKLIQLNKKYDFLSTAKVCIDLCAAPGGWCQVAAKYMPASSIILGIDLLPIRPIRGVKTFQCDITTVRCRQIIKQEMQSWQADVVLCDGAPNVGAEYSKDAYVQNELALVALKLAVDVMGRGGTFVSKVFRSQDYNALLWVFKQLFKKVSATKPLSSRNESAEIFVVCEQYLAPQSIDPKLFDPKYVFDQVDAQEKTITIFHPKFGDRKRHREGYDEALGMMLTNECSVSQFIDAHDPIRLLTDTTSIKFLPEDDVYRDHKDTSDEIVTCLSDLKVCALSFGFDLVMVGDGYREGNEDFKAEYCLSPTVVPAPD